VKPVKEKRKRESAVGAERSANHWHRTAFWVSIAGISRLLIVRDRALGWTKCGRIAAGVNERASRHSIASAAHTLDAVFVEPTSTPARAAVLLCHGIGETVEQWFGVQQLFAAQGIASLVFDYSGFGKSKGLPRWEQLEEDAISAFALLERLTPEIPISLLGFSLGTGVAAATIRRIGAHRLVLCQGFTSFRNAAAAGGIPRHLGGLVPPIWHAQPELEQCELPVLIVHGEKDQLFPVAMAHEMAGWCKLRAEVVVVPNTTHNQPFRKPHLSYWGPIIEWIGRPAASKS
jgi:uncharacterized protein